MLKNVMITTGILEELGFSRVKSSNKKETIMKRGDIEAEVLPNGFVKIGNELTEFKKVKKYKIAGI